MNDLKTSLIEAVSDRLKRFLAAAPDSIRSLDHAADGAFANGEVETGTEMTKKATKRYSNYIKRLNQQNGQGMEKK